MPAPQDVVKFATTHTHIDYNANFPDISSAWISLPPLWSGVCESGISRSVVVIGNFDGVHLGHQHLLQQARRISDRLTVLTFWPHPQQFFSHKRGQAISPFLIMAPIQRYATLAHYGVDAIVSLPFDEQLASCSPERFIDEVLKPLDPQAIVVGEGFRYGHQRSGNIDQLRRSGLSVLTVDPVRVDAPHTADGVVSSTAVRGALAARDLKTVARLLGRPYRLVGRVESGDGLGRTTGYPTLNINVGPMLLPGTGVFAALVGQRCGRDEQSWQAPAAMYVGFRAGLADLVDVSAVRFEVHLLRDSDISLYDHHQPLWIEPVSFIRLDRVLSLAQLPDQIAQDIKAIRKVLQL